MGQLRPHADHRVNQQRKIGTKGGVLRIGDNCILIMGRQRGSQVATRRKSRNTNLVFGNSPFRSPFAHQLDRPLGRSEEHTSELQSLMRTSYAVFCLKKKK